MLKKLNDFLAGVPATIVAGLFLLLDLVPHLVEEFCGAAVNLNFLPFDPAWVTVIISGIPMLYLALWRVIHNPGISKISSALLITIAMFAAIAVAVVVYLVMISATRAVTKSDMALIPGGHHLTKILHLHDERQGKGKHCR